MKLHPDNVTSLNTITGYGDGYILVNARRFDSAILVMPEQPVIAWPVASFESLTAADFEALLAAKPELVLLGTGPRQRFPAAHLTQALTGARIGIEAMDTRAACRTYNILMTEGRQVMAALLW